ncbi:hypothetical protein Patl1_13878 [Pistacia atlantica]|uniref:Uncharacterized protein n=1 Tax=Pistacia atlantica TaxID=434234 RepID=A0ACC1AVW9_9ROSI|nr:hypothetical protein Patl1_13878 [Pistacia atlantica]
MASMAATFAMISSLCVRRKKSVSPSMSADKLKSSASASPQNLYDVTSAMTCTETSMIPPSPLPSPPQAQATSSSALECEGNSANNVEQVITDQLPLPPAMKKLTEAYSCSNIPTESSVQKTETSVSMKMSRTLSSLKNQDKKKKGKFKSDQDSVWTKPILLGERCRPDEEDAIIYDNEGNKISTYSHKKTRSNYSLSRTNSFIDERPTSGKEKDKGRNIIQSNFLSLSRTNSLIHQSSISGKEKYKGKNIIQSTNFSLSRTNTFIDQSSVPGKTQNKFSMSRTNTFIDQRVISGLQEKEKGIIRKDEQVLG